jgi:hypothetical protein
MYGLAKAMPLLQSLMSSIVSGLWLGMTLHQKL